MRKEPIAIIGVGCRFPGVNNPQDFWKLLCNGVDAITEVPTSRWDLDEYYDPDPTQPHKMSTRWGGFLDQVDQFDPQFFGIAPREVNSMDPQQRLMLETTWEALEDAGQVPKQLSGSKTGVFVGVSSHDYSSLVISDDPYSLTGNTNCIVPNRLSYVFNFKGPSFAVDTACSSSLVAVHLACQSLHSGECTLAIAGGVQVLLSADLTVSFSKAGLLSPDGRCKTFDAKANGYVRSEGAGAVVLKPLSQAQKDGDPIYAVILGSAVNQDGRSNGLSAPNPEAQEAVVRAAFAQAGISPGQAQYIEAHGTGTKIGDPLELKALGAAIAESRSPGELCAVGSVKTNLGHSETAAGITGLIKTALALKHQQIPPSIHFQEPNPYIDFNALPLRVQQTLEPWPIAEGPALAGVNSFGFGGTNAHVVLQEAPQPEAVKLAANPAQPFGLKRPRHLLALSAKSAPALKALAERYQDLLTQQPFIDPAHLCYTANTRRSHFAHRLILSGTSAAEMQSHLADWINGQTDSPHILSGQVSGKKAPRVTFLFTGQGAQYWGMGKELYQTQPLFRAILDRCNELLQPYLQPSLLEVLFSEPEASRSNGQSNGHLTENLLDQTLYTQPALFALEYALAQLWISWGIKPAVVMGHSVGEYVAACIAGVFSLEDGLKLIATRGRLMQALPQDGAMVAVLADEVTLKATLNGNGVAIAAINGPYNFVLSGKKEAIAQVTTTLEAQQIKTKALAVSHAFHSPLMEPMLSEFAQVASEVTYARPQISLISNLTGAPIGSDIATPEYWCLHVRQPVNFAASMQTLERQGEQIFLEIGPKPVLLGMGRACITHEACLWLPSLRPQQSDWQQLLHSLSLLHLQGVEVDWAGFDQNYPRKLVALPTYPFQRQRYWWSEADLEWSQGHRSAGQTLAQFAAQGSAQTSAQTLAQPIHPLLGRRIPADNPAEIWFESQLNAPALAYLQDHCVLEQPVLPATAYLELAAAAGEALQKDPAQSLQIQSIVIEQPLHLNQQEQLRIQLTPLEEGYRFQVLSQNAAHRETSTRHAAGTIRWGSSELSTSEQTHLEQPIPLSLDDAKRSCPQVKSVGYHYRQLALRGLDYGPMFQGVQALWFGPDQALGRICLPAEAQSANTVSQSSSYQIHPALLDACLQVFASAIEEFPVVYLPVGIEQYQVFDAIPNEVWSFVRTRSHQKGSLYADLTLYDLAGAPVAEIRGLTLRSLSRPILQRLFQRPLDLNPWLYQIQWQPQALQPSTASQSSQRFSLSGTWLIFADAPQSWAALGEQFLAKGDRPIWVLPEAAYRATDSEIGIRSDVPADFQTLLQDVTAQPDFPLKGILYLWSAAQQQGSNLALNNGADLCGGLLNLVQALAPVKTLQTKALQTTGHPGTHYSPRLLIATAGAQVVEGPSDSGLQQPSQVEQAALWGLGRTIALEFPDLQCVRIDLDPTLDSSAISALVAECYGPKTADPETEDQIAYRQGTRYVSRLVRPSQSASQAALQRPDKAFQLKIADYGILDRLTLAPVSRKAPAPGEVEIEVYAAGLNFRDVLNALGMLKDYLAEMGLPEATDIPFGGECAGKIVALGEGVEELQVGDEVIAANAIGSLASFVTTPAAFVVQKPATLSFAEAATLSTAFLTAQYALNSLAQIKRGDRVLIHSAAGGVGQAAVQLAQQAGAEIFATASPGKWDLLKGMGITQVFNSRTLDFADKILAQTDGKGVDVVLNSFNGDFIPKNLECLAPQGRFIEIGKIGIWTEAEIHDQRPDVRYVAFDLLELSQAQPDQFTALLQGLMPAFSRQALRPLPHQTFAIEEAVSAFRHMAQAKHTGKVVLNLQQPRPVAKKRIHADKTYLITGGLGALGLQVAQWLVEQGARHLVLLGRSAPSEVAQETIQYLQRHGQGKHAEILTAQGDVAQLDSLRQVFEQVKASMPPLAGIFHTAGVLRDGLLQQQSAETFAQVMAPKVTGTWNLHQLSQALYPETPLDFFVCFSSIASLIGSPGQGNYAAANAFMDGFAHYRRSLGLAGLSINWGPWGGAGMAGQLSDRDRARIASTGITPLRPGDGLQALEQLLLKPQSYSQSHSQSESLVPQLGILDLDWSKFLQQFPTVPAFLKNLAVVAEPKAKSAFLSQLEKTPSSARKEFLSSHVRSQIAKVLGLSSPDEVGLDQSFADLGMDSLMGMEMKSRLQTSLNHTFPATLAADYPTVGSLIDYLAQDVLALGAGSVAPEAPDLAAQGLIAPSPTVPSPPTSQNSPAEPAQFAQSIAQRNGQTSNGKSSPAASTFTASTFTAPTFDESAIAPEFYDFKLSPAYLNLQQYLEQGKQIGNPFFTVHDGVAKDTTSVGGETLINFSSYNYLGFCGDPDISNAAKAAIDRYGTSVSASRIVSGERHIHRELEQAIADFLGTEDCITYVGGHATNVSTIGELMGKSDLIVCDAFCHNSIQQGCELSGATVIPFPHNDVQKLEEILQTRRAEFEKTLIVIEGVYSADGDLPPLLSVVALKKRYKAFLMVDEAHSMGVLGARGRGVAEYFGIDPTEVDLWMGTLSKSLASCGGYIAANQEIVEFLKYSAPGFISSVGMTPPNAAAALAALKKLQAEPERVAKLHERTALFLKLAQSHGFNTGTSKGSPIVPIMIGDPYQAVRLSKAMVARGINVQPMLFPTVPFNEARLRFFLSCTHTEDQIHHTIAVLVEEMAKIKNQAQNPNAWLHYLMRARFLTDPDPDSAPRDPSRDLSNLHHEA